MLTADVNTDFVLIMRIMFAYYNTNYYGTDYYDHAVLRNIGVECLLQMSILILY